MELLENYILKTPKTVWSGIGSMKVLTTVVEGYKKIAIFTDQGLLDSGFVEYPLSYIKKSSVPYEIITTLPKEPTYDEAQTVIDKFHKVEADLIIAIGGGSVMDIAKLASIMSSDHLHVKTLLETPMLGKKSTPTLMIPTTAGTGAEATPNSIVEVPEKKVKVGIVNEAMIADFVILDGTMLSSLPRHIAAATGVDALCHGIECFTSKKANPFSNLVALESLDLIFNNIEKACEEGSSSLEAKQAMLLASFYAGIAITASGTTAVHALSYPLGGTYHIPHGVANAILLLPVMKFNAPACGEHFSQLYRRLGNPGNLTTSEEQTEWIIQRLEQILHTLDIPTSLKQYNVPKDDLDDLVSAGMSVTRLLVNNIRDISQDDAKNLYKEIL